MSPDDRESRTETRRQTDGGSSSPSSAGITLAIGASAAEPASLIRVLTGLPRDANLAVVLTLQGREVLDEEAFQQALGACAGALADVADGTPIEAGRIYLPGPDLAVTVEGGRLRVRPAEQSPGQWGTIDSLFVSLAEDQGPRAVGLVLAGTGGDGTLGLTALKEAGGLTVAEGSADQVRNLIASNSPVALADLVLPTDAIAERLATQIEHFAQREEAAAAEVQASGAAETVTRIAAILRERTGHDFHGYKRNTFLRRVQRRMQVVEADGFDAYIELLRTRPDEPQQLFNDLLIGVTQFFRDRREFKFLETNVIPKMFEGKGRGDQVRVWVLGCSTGEEAYSIAILLKEFAARLDAPPLLQIFASDIDGRALAAARVGRYTRSIVDDVSPERLTRWFIKEGNTYCIVKELRETCIFAQHSVIKDTPFSRLDLISCRNLLIYLDSDLQDRVIPLFHFALRPGGCLFLGNAENASRHPRLFEPLDRGHRIFRKVETERHILPDLSFTTSDPGYPRISSSPARLSGQDLVRRAERLAERYAPAYAIVDERFDVLHFSARAGRFIHPTGGAPSLNLLNLVHTDLRLELRGALSQAAQSRHAVRTDGLWMSTDGGQRVAVDLVIEPVQDAEDAPSPQAFVVLFKDGVVLGSAIDAASGKTDADAAHLNAELRVTRERLQATIEELESTNEELRSSNEEYQSLNEELQSANEELATSKEELQSVNEELTTVNGELAHRIEELARANSDLKNLLESTQIATLFLDNELRVTNFTPSVADLFPLVETDAGRPIGHIKSLVVYDEFQDDVRRVVRTLGTVEREIENPTSGTRYMARVLPYRSVDNFIAGAVATFTDITLLTRAQRALRESEARMRSLLEGIPQLVWRAAHGGLRTWSSPQWIAFTGLSEEQSSELGWLGAVHSDDREATMAAWREAADTGVYQAEHRIRSAGEGCHRWFQTRATPMRDETGRIVEWLGTSTDIEALRRLQERQAVMVAELQHRTRNLLAVVRSIAVQTIGSANSLAEFRERFNDRLSALSRVQGLLSRSARDPITIGDLVRTELDALGTEAVADGRMSLAGPEVELRNSLVQTFALALHELATNARKYGAFATDRGRLDVTWRVLADDGEGRRLLLNWVETGIDRDREEQSPTRRGYGRQLIDEALPYSLGAKTRFELDDSGVRCMIDLPLEKRRGELEEGP